ncbi:MAG: hypothetical protein ABH864_02880 [archaeon]
MGLLRSAAVGLLLFAAGCSSVRTGFGYRQVSGSYSIYDYDGTILFVRVQENKKLGENLEGYLRGDFICGEVCAEPESLRGSANGFFGVVGTGVSYSLADWLSVDFGGELFNSRYDMEFCHGRVGMTTPDSVWGWGLNAGVTLQKPIGERGFFFISGGYNLDDTMTRESNVNFSGAFGVVGVGIEF